MSGFIISDKYEINVIGHEIQTLDVLCETNLNIFIVHENKILYTLIQKYDAAHELAKCKDMYFLGDLIYLEFFIKRVIENNNIKLMKWFIKSNIIENEKYLWYVVEYSAKWGRLKLLKWLNKYNKNIKIERGDIIVASIYGHTKVLKWFKTLKFKFQYDKIVVDSHFYSAYNHEYTRTIFLKSFKFWCENIHIKKIIKWARYEDVKALNFKAKNKYFKGYKKN